MLFLDALSFPGMLFGMLVLLGPMLIVASRSKTRLSEILVKVGLSFFSLLSTTLILEMAARAVLPQPRFDPVLPYYPYTNVVTRVNLQGVSPEIRRTTNEWGFRGDAPPEHWEEAYTIITVGGSTTQCFYLDDADTWPALLQNHLRQDIGSTIWVGNAGIDGHSTRGHLVVMDRVIRELRPDAVILLVGANDLAYSLWPDQPNFDNARLSLAFDSQLFRTAWMMHQLATGESVAQGSAHGNFEPVPVDPATLTPLPGNLRELLPSLAVYRKNLNQIIDMAHEMGAKLLFLTQPALFDNTPYWDGLDGWSSFMPKRTINISAATYWRLLDLFNQELLNVCEERQVACYDLAAKVPHSDEYFYDSVHFTEAGAALVAEEVAWAVEQTLLAGKLEP